MNEGAGVRIEELYLAIPSLDKEIAECREEQGTRVIAGQPPPRPQRVDVAELADWRLQVCEIQLSSSGVCSTIGMSGVAKRMARECRLSKLPDSHFNSILDRSHDRSIP